MSASYFASLFRAGMPFDAASAATTSETSATTTVTPGDRHVDEPPPDPEVMTTRMDIGGDAQSLASTASVDPPSKDDKQHDGR